MEWLKWAAGWLEAFAGLRIFSLGGAALTVGRIISIVVLLALLFWLTRRLTDWLVRRLIARGTERGAGHAIGSIARYGILLVGTLAILQGVGLDLSALLVVGGALGIGIGLGLQSVTSNFVSGLIILFERPIKVGDRIEVGNLLGDVVEINPRATTVITNDNVAVIVPNSEFVSGRVVNWSFTDRKVRYRIPVRVSYRSDPEQVREVLLGVARGQPGVLEEPPPEVRLDELGDNGLLFELHVWTVEFIARPGSFRSALNFALFAALGRHGIEIPFPQRELHVRGSLPAAGAQPGAAPAEVQCPKPSR